jgi:hypothetical protein
MLEMAELLPLIFVALVEILDVFDAISESFEVIAFVLAAISLSLDEIFDVFELICPSSDSTSDIDPRVKVPSISASLSIVTVPLVFHSDKSPDEKFPYKRFELLAFDM